MGEANAADGPQRIRPAKLAVVPRSWPETCILGDGAPDPAAESAATASYYLGSRRLVGDGESLTAPQDAPTTAARSGDHAAAEGASTGIGRYRPLRLLGEGTFGIVQLAFDEQLRREVALKLPRRPRIADEAEVIDFLAEAQALASLDHPHIVPIYDLGRDPDGRCYVVSKLLRGGDLKSRLEEHGPLDPREATELVRKIALALDHAHRGGLIHRDIKPANILLDEAGAPYVTDFGLALKTEDIQLASGAAGTPAYMSPEQIAGDAAALDRRSDLFSLGIVLYELLTGERPFRAPNLAALVHQICSADPLPPHLVRPGLSPTLSHLCMSCLAKSPGDRFNSCGILAQALARWLEHGESPAADDREQGRPAEAARGGSPLVATALGGLMVGLAVAAWSWWNLRDIPRDPAPAAGPMVYTPPQAVSPAPTVIYRDREVPVYMDDDPPPFGYSRQTWELLPESTRRALRDSDPTRSTLGGRRPSSSSRRDPFDISPPGFNRPTTDPYDPLGRRRPW